MGNRILDVFVTGTHVYGPLSNTSDIDIVVIDPAARFLEETLNSYGIITERTEQQEQFPEYSGFYFKIGLILFNVIRTMDSKEHEAWYYATQKMLDVEPIDDKYKRKELFQSYRAEYKRRK
jgi:predicted secreted protein